MNPTTEVNDTGRECTSCHIFKPWEEYCGGSGARGRVSMCRECRNTRQRVARRSYERDTKKGFLVRLYRNMQSRVTGVQRHKMHLYAGVRLLPREQFYEWALSSAEFHRLWDVWKASGEEQRLVPTVARIDSFYGYELWNMEWQPQYVNSQRGAFARHGIIGSGKYAA